MSCLSPLMTTRGVDLNTGEVKWFFLGKYNPDRAYRDNYTGYEFGETIPRTYKIPCGKCLGCKMDYARQWADRLTMELLTYNEKAIFLTLTYSNPPKIEVEGKAYFTLKKKDVQDFMKRLREHYRDYMNGVPLRFFACGEYGSKLYTNRPHYHLIIFGLSLDDFRKKRTVDRNELGQYSYSCEELEKIWNNGLISFSEVSYDTMSYVARYNAKKVFGDNEKPHNESEDSFVLMSRCPGIGKQFILEHPDFVKKRRFYITDSRKVREIRFPRYGNKVLEFKGTEEYYEYVRKNVDDSIDHDMQEMAGTDLPFDELMKVKAGYLEDRVKSLLYHRKEI